MNHRGTSPPNELKRLIRQRENPHLENSPTWTRYLPLLLAAGTLLLLAACSSTPVPVAGTGDGRFDYVSSIRVNRADTVQEIEGRYDATVVSWHPEAGFAVLGIERDARGPTTLSDADDNQDALSSPEVASEGLSLWAGGISSWAGGMSAWAGGISAWAGGEVENPFPGNEDDWSAIRIAEAQSLATNLGLGVKVAVIDTGLDLAHEAFTGKLAPEAEWRDFVDGDGTPQDEEDGTAYGHGTAVAGVILQAAPNATILPLRVLRSDGYGDVTDVVAAIDWAVQNGAKVINLSLGTNVEIEALSDIVNYAQSQGIPVISSSGNSGDTAVTFPAAKSLDRVTGGRPIGVGSTNADDTKSGFSTYGSNLEMLAPGNGIATLYPANQRAYATGTSFAGPWVSGTLALMLGENPGNSNPSATVTQTATKIDTINPGLEKMLGFGRLDAEAAVKKWLGIK